MRILLEEAQELALKHTDVLPLSWVSLEDAFQRVLAQSVFAAIDQPPFSRSPLDGYAVRGEDTRNASLEHPAVLRVVSKQFAGQTAQIKVNPGEAVRLMTGAMIPEGANSVIRQEDTDLGEKYVRIFQPVSPGINFCRKGEEYRAGAELLARGTRLDAAALAVAAGNGMTKLPVYRGANVSVLSTGSEVCRPGQPLPAGKIFDSNTAYLSARLQQMGASVIQKNSVEDDRLKISAAILNCTQADLLITTGGISVGEKDLVEEALRDIGAEIFFHGVAIKPGMPTLLAKYGYTMILGLSGNPFAAAVPFELIARPILSKMTCDPTLELHKSFVTMAVSYEKASRVRRFLRGYSDGQTVWIPNQQANGQMRSMVGSNCLVEIPAGTGPVLQGETVSVIWI